MMMADVPTEIGNAKISSGDLVFGDVDGVVVIPADISEEVIQSSMERISEEDKVRRELSRGIKLNVVFEKYGIL